MVSNFCHHTLSNKHSLRSAKATESSVGHGIGFSYAGPGVDIGDEVTAVDMSECSLNNSATKIL